MNSRPMDHRPDPLVLSTFLYRYRNLVEHFFNKLKHYRDRHPIRKRAAHYFALLKLAAIRVWLRRYDSVSRVSRVTATIIGDSLLLTLRISLLAAFGRRPRNLGVPGGPNCFKVSSESHRKLLG